MKRKSNGLIVGTVLVVLIGALIFLQARNQEPEEEDPMSGPMPTAPAPGAAGPGPRVDEHLDAPSGGRMPAPALTQ
jgi:hypothetical protein